jgi:uncharacterized membrane protein YraQ (UPF0718 family)
MLISAIILWSVAVVLGGYTMARPGRQHLDAFRIASRQALVILPRMPIAILAAGFIGELLPEQTISTWIGVDSGILGILIAGLVGALLPSGPIISFPVAIALMELGAGTPQLVAFLTAWSAFAMHRLLMWEIPLMGMAFASKRLLVSLALPPIAGLIAWAMLA